MNKPISETRLKEFCGQRCDVVITLSGSGARVRFESVPGFGFPSLEIEDLEKLVARVKVLQELAK